MKTPIVDTDVVSFIFKQDTRAALYEPHLLNTFPAISFMTLAELEKWAISANWGRAKYKDLQENLDRYTVIFPDNALRPRVGRSHGTSAS